MTREEIKNTPKLVDFMLDKWILEDSRIKMHKRLEEVCDLATKALEQESILDKIRAEVMQLDYDTGDILEIIDKYKAETSRK